MIRAEVLPTRHRKLVSRGSWFSRMGRCPCTQSIANNCLCFLQDAMQMVRSPEAFCIDFVDVFSPRRPRREPSALRHYLQPSDRGTITWRVGKDSPDFFASQVFDFNLLRRELLQCRLLFRSGWGFKTLVNRLTEFLRQVGINLARVAPCSGSDLCCKQSRDHPVLVRSPNAAIQADERRTGAFFTAEAKRAVEQAIHKPLETNGYLIELTVKPGGDTVNHLAAHYRFANRCYLAPLRPVLKEVVDGYRKIMIGWEQSRTSGDNPMPVMVRITRESEVVLIFQADQALHRIGRGGVHADLAVPIHRHETKGGIDGFIDDREVQPIAFGNRLPIVDPGPAEWINPQADPGIANNSHIHHKRELIDVSIEIIVAMCCGCPQGFLERDSLYTFKPTLQKLVCFRFDPVGD